MSDGRREGRKGTGSDPRSASMSFINVGQIGDDEVSGSGNLVVVGNLQ